jgi:hypothetical protein
MADRGREPITATSSGVFGPQMFHPCVLINRGAQIAYGTADETIAVKEIGFSLAPNEAVNTKDLPAAWQQGNFRFVCSTGETAIIDWSIQ